MMNILSEIMDLVVYLVQKARDLILYTVDQLYRLADIAIGRFRDVGFAEKLVVLNTVPAFFAIIMSVAQYYIFETWFYINNPLAVYLIAIVAGMLVSVFFEGPVKLLARVLLNAYYLAWVVYLPLAGELTKADPHTLRFGYYLNIIVPVVYIGASLVTFFFDER
ncbi:MAG: hypothetical protein KBA15_02025 [Spirochaetes bacterium]|jgi:hypothetical protein|nr:hypothetical protein [Spirochaetota bacterium]